MDLTMTDAFAGCYDDENVIPTAARYVRQWGRELALFNAREFGRSHGRGTKERKFFRAVRESIEDATKPK